jgi:hypothetical protein
VGERASANSKTRVVRLFQDTDVAAIPHEVGHVLGFPDRYYTVWDPHACEYLDEVTGTDLMSDHRTGSVLDEDWNELARAYPLASPAPSAAGSGR